MAASRPTPYDDIIHLPHPVSATHPPMSMEDRAAQFMPFKALTEYESAVDETARQTDRKIELDDDAIARLNKMLLIIHGCLDDGDRPTCTITYFVPDINKAGGQYVSITSPIKGIDRLHQCIILEDYTTIAIDDLLEIQKEEEK